MIQLVVQSPPYFELKFISNTVVKGETNLSLVQSLCIDFFKHFEFPSGSLSILQCEAQGDPVMRVEWQKDKQQISEVIDKRYSIKQEIISPQKMISYLEIAATVRHDSALYTCLVSNDFGSDDTNIQLIVQGMCASIKSYIHCRYL